MTELEIVKLGNIQMDVVLKVLKFTEQNQTNCDD